MKNGDGVWKVRILTWEGRKEFSQNTRKGGSRPTADQQCKLEQKREACRMEQIHDFYVQDLTRHRRLSMAGTKYPRMSIKRGKSDFGLWFLGSQFVFACSIDSGLGGGQARLTSGCLTDIQCLVGHAVNSGHK